MGGLVTVHNIRAEKGHRFVGFEGLLLSFLSNFDPSPLFVFSVCHVVFNWKNCDHVGDTVLLGELGRSHKEVALACDQ